MPAAASRCPLSFLFRLDAPVGRRTYALLGLALLVFKYATDALLHLAATGRWWSPFAYLHPFLSGRVALGTAPDWFVWALGAWSVPFLWAAVALTARRAVDAGQSPWSGVLAVLPLLNVVAFALLCVAPSQPPQAPVQEAEARRPELQRLGVVLRAMLGAAAYGLGMVGFCVYGLGAYGGVLFVGTPVVMGAVVGFALGRDAEATVGATLRTTALTLLLTAGGLLLFALEGAVCIAMAVPLALPCAAAGALLGRALARRSAPLGATPVVLLLLLPLLAGFESVPREEPVFEMASSVDIDAPPEAVWPRVVGFGELPPETEWVFRLGIASPRRARIEGAGVGAVRYCEFTTGPFVEPVTAWEPPHRLAFDVTSQPAPMQEWSPFQGVHPPHLDGYLRSQRGEFRLVPLEGGRTRLEGRTWYTLDLAPLPYWRLWSDWLIHAIHLRVLGHVKTLAEHAHLAPLPLGEGRGEGVPEVRP